MTVDHLKARLAGCVRSGNHLNSIRNVTGSEIVYLLCVNGVRQPEVLSYRHMRWHRHGDGLCVANQWTQRTNEYGDKYIIEILLHPFLIHPFNHV